MKVLSVSMCERVIVLLLNVTLAHSLFSLDAMPRAVLAVRAGGKAGRMTKSQRRGATNDWNVALECLLGSSYKMCGYEKVWGLLYIFSVWGERSRMERVVRSTCRGFYKIVDDAFTLSGVKLCALCPPREDRRIRGLPASIHGKKAHLGCKEAATGGVGWPPLPTFDRTGILGV